MDSRTPAEQAEDDYCLLPRIPTDRCWFCLRKFKKGQWTNRHHLVAVRYIRASIIPFEFHRIYVKVHCFCHVLWHIKHDNGLLNWLDYRAAMRDRNYGYGIFANARWLRKGRTPQPLNNQWAVYHPRAA